MVPATADNKDLKTVLPAKISKDDAAGMLLQHNSMKATTHSDGHQTESVTAMSSSDGKFSTGMYRSGKTRFEISQPYGGNEFMYFLSGGAVR